MRRWSIVVVSDPELRPVLQRRCWSERGAWRWLLRRNVWPPAPGYIAVVRRKHEHESTFEMLDRERDAILDERADRQLR